MKTVKEKYIVTELKESRNILHNEIATLRTNESIIQNDLEHYENTLKSTIEEMKEKQEILRCTEELIIRLEPDWLINENFENHLKIKKRSESLKGFKKELKTIKNQNNE